MRFVMVPNKKRAPVGKLADAELHFDRRDGLLDSVKLTGFAIWESQLADETSNAPHLRVTPPSRSYVASGETRNFNLLRAVEGSPDPWS